jgi:hypothetical protein
LDLKSRHWAVGFSIFLLLSLVFASEVAIEVGADIANVSYLDNGATFHNATHLRMPEANAEIIFMYGNSSSHVSIACEFRIISNTTQNTTLAFVLPRISTLYGLGSTPSFSEISIEVDSEQTNYTSLTWEQLNWSAPLDSGLHEASWLWLNTSEYAVFNVKLFEDVPINVTVSSIVINPATSYQFILSYTVGSARTFDGDTHQRVHARIIEEKPLIDLNYWPLEFLENTTDNGTTDLTWDFNISEFALNEVTFSCTLVQYSGISPPPIEHWPDLWPAGISILSVSILMIAVIGFLVFRKQAP